MLTSQKEYRIHTLSSQAKLLVWDCAWTVDCIWLHRTFSKIAASGQVTPGRNRFAHLIEDQKDDQWQLSVYSKLTRLKVEFY